MRIMVNSLVTGIETGKLSPELYSSLARSTVGAMYIAVSKHKQGHAQIFMLGFHLSTDTGWNHLPASQRKDLNYVLLAHQTRRIVQK